VGRSATNRLAPVSTEIAMVMGSVTPPLSLVPAICNGSAMIAASPRVPVTHHAWAQVMEYATEPPSFVSALLTGLVLLANCRALTVVLQIPMLVVFVTLVTLVLAAQIFAQMLARVSVALVGAISHLASRVLNAIFLVALARAPL
jgi:hypothetical protein